ALPIYPQRIDIGEGRHRLAADLLRGRVVQGERARAGAGVVRQVGAVEQLGDAEVEQAHLVQRRDQDVGRLEVAVDAEGGVRVAEIGRAACRGRVRCASGR